MQNLHSHKYYSNVFASFKDSHVSYEDYAKRAVELGQKVITSVEHGYQGNYLRCWEMAQQYNLKFVFGVEAYWVKDRTEPDNTNAHIIILARNKAGMLQINKMLAEANKTGFYGKPRVDMELLRTLHPPDVFITTACVAFWGKPKDGTVKWHYSDDNMSRQIDALFAEIYGHFGSSLYLEVQAHNTSWQRIINQHVLDLHYRYGVPLIVGLDSHYIYPEQRLERQILREESGAKKLDEDFEFDDDVYEDYPDEQTVIARFQKQGVLNESEIAEAIANTDIALTFEDIEFDRERKLPKTYRGMDREQCAKEYERRIHEGFKKYVDNLQLPPEEAQRRWDDMWTQECGPVIQEGQAVYFLLNSDIIALGQKMGGTYTNSGRGSAGSFFSNKLLGMTGLDRFELPVTLYPGRFMTPERLKTSLPDIDANVSDQLIFAKAQEELMGKDHVAPMIAYGTQKPKSAFRMYARAKNLPMDIQTKVSKQIEAYERAVQNADDEDEKESIFIEDYVDAEYMEYVTASEPYRGIVVSKSQAPCGFLLYDGDIESEIGIIRVLGKSSKKVSYCTVIDGYTADAFGYVKNDELQVIVCAINAAASAKAGIPYLTAEELIARTKNDPATWNIFAKGYTMGVNQCQGAKTIEKLMQYKPRSLQDMSAFVAAIRPGFKSMINKFLAREKFSYGVPAFDAQLHNDSSGSSWFLYQEDTMKILNLAGFPLEETYPIIKAISKKKVKVIEAAHTRFIEGFIAYQKEHGEKSDSKAKENAEMVWKVIYDSAAYQFNSSHSVAVALDAIYGAYLKAHYPLEYYTTLLDTYAAKGDKDKVALIKDEMRRAFNIMIVPCKFRDDNRLFSFDKANNTISDALPSIRNLSVAVAEELFKMRDNVYSTFVDLLVDMTNRKPFNATNIEVLIKMDYFREFGHNGKLMEIWQQFRNGEGTAFKKTYVAATQQKRIAILKDFESSCPDSALSPYDQLSFEAIHYGSPISLFPDAKNTYVVMDVDTKYSPKLSLYSGVTGRTGTVKMKKNIFAEQPLEVGDVVIIGGKKGVDWKNQPKYTYIDGKSTPIPGSKELWVYNYVVALRHDEVITAKEA